MPNLTDFSSQLMACMGSTTALPGLRPSKLKWTWNNWNGPKFPLFLLYKLVQGEVTTVKTSIWIMGGFCPFPVQISGSLCPVPFWSGCFGPIPQVGRFVESLQLKFFI